ncbi:LuxR family transcriptional regulator, partial [Micromonospora sp. M51]|nr:LuxR family transcriptional regulator [Micromonospora sp. M51]
IDPKKAARVAAEAAADAEALGEQVALLSTRIALLCHGERDLTGGLAELGQAAAAARAAGDAPTLVLAMVFESDMLCELGRYAESAQAAEAGATEARRVGISRSTGAYLLSNRAEALIALGRWDEAEAVCAEAARIDLSGVTGLHWLQLGAGLRLARAHPGADELVDRALTFLNRPYLWPNHRLPLHELAIEAALAADDKVEAVRAARVAVTDESLPQLPREGWPVLSAAARTAARVGDRELAAAVATLAADLPARHPAARAHAAQVGALLAVG